MSSALSVGALLDVPRPRRTPDVVGVLVALTLHGALVLAPAPLPPPPAPLPPLEVSLDDLPAPDPAPAPGPAPAPAPDPVDAPSPKAAEPVAAAPKAPVAAPAPAAPPVDVPSGPVIFDGASGDWELGVKSGDGTGSVLGAQGHGGGSARPGTTQGTSPVAVRSAPPPGPARSGAAARVVLEDGCAGFFPTGASHDVAEVVVRAFVSAGGTLESVLVASESPAGEGFGAAARACVGRARAEAARDADGRTLASATVVRVRFVR